MKRLLAAVIVFGAGAACPVMAQIQPAADPAAPAVVVPQSPSTTDYDVTKGFPDRNGPFSAMLVVIPKAQMAEFDQPGGARHLDRVARAEAGADLAIKVLFTGMKGDWNGLGNVTYDVQILQPDGKVYGNSDYRNIDALHGKVGSGDGVFDNRNKVVMLQFDKADLPGVYTIKTTVHDRVAQRDVPLLATIELLPQRVAAAEPVAGAATAVPAPDATAPVKKKSRRHRRHRH